MSEWQQQLRALEALVTAPFVIFLIVLIATTLAVVAYTERSGRS